MVSLLAIMKKGARPKWESTGESMCPFCAVTAIIIFVSSYDGGSRKRPSDCCVHMHNIIMDAFCQAGF
jgi:hypothetical protein